MNHNGESLLEQCCQALKAARLDKDRRRAETTASVLEQLAVMLRPVAEKQLAGPNRKLDADDVVQETLLTMWAVGFERYEQYVPLYPVVLRILANKCIDANRRSQRRRFQCRDHEFIEERRPDQEAIRRQHAGLVREAMERLDPQAKQIIHRRYFAGRNGREIGDEFGMSDGKVNTSAHRSRAEMREHLRGRGVRWEHLE